MYHPQIFLKNKKLPEYFFNMTDETRSMIIRKLKMKNIGLSIRFVNCQTSEPIVNLYNCLSISYHSEIPLEAIMPFHRNKLLL